MTGFAKSLFAKEALTISTDKMTATIYPGIIDNKIHRDGFRGSLAYPNTAEVSKR